MNDRQRRVQQLLLVLADRSRFHMLCVLAEHPVHVSELGRAVGLSQSCATRHVQALSSAGAVECRRDGKRVMVQVRTEDEVVRTLIAWMLGAGEAPAAVAAPVAKAESPAPIAARTAEVASRRDVAGARASASPTSRKSQHKERTPVPAPDSGKPAPAQAEQAPSMDTLPAARRALEDFLL